MPTPRSSGCARPLGDGNPIDRRTAVTRMSAAVASAAWPAGLATAAGERPHALLPEAGRTRLRKIATEEAFTIPEVAAAMRDVARRGGTNLDLTFLRLTYDPSPVAPPAGQSPPAGSRDALARSFLPRLLDLDSARLAEMDANGVDMHLLSLTLNGFMVNSHTQNGYLDEQRFWPILEDPAVLRLCVEKIGIDNVMWAIDYPFQPTAPAVAFVESAPLSDQEREQIAHGNAERIFGLRS